MAYEFSRHHETSPDIYCKGVVYDFPGYGLYRIIAGFIICRGIVDEDIDSSESLHRFRINLFDRVLIGNVFFQYQVFGTQFLEPVFY